MFLFEFIEQIRSNRIVKSSILFNLILLGAFYVWSFDKTITPENFYYQPFFLKLFVFANLPAVLVTGLLLSPMPSSETIVGPFSELLWLYYGTLICVYILQWTIVGQVISKIWSFTENPYAQEKITGPEKLPYTGYSCDEKDGSGEENLQRRNNNLSS